MNQACGTILIDGQPVGAAMPVELGMPISDVAMFGAVGGEYRCEVTVDVRGVESLMAQMQAFCGTQPIEVVEHYLPDAFPRDVAPVIGIYPGRAVAVRRGGSFSLTTPSKLTGWSEVSEPDGSAQAILELVQGDNAT